ncbi:hypothetical protein [Bradyrhizobium diazoefficiens]
MTLSDQIENLEDLVGHDAKAGKAFFDKTYVTGGMKTLLRLGLQRLAGTSSQAVFELKQAMGGGKTHSMLALGYLAANPSLFPLVDVEITKGIKLSSAAKVVAISGRSISREKHLWGDRTPAADVEVLRHGHPGRGAPGARQGRHGHRRAEPEQPALLHA